MLSALPKYLRSTVGTLSLMGMGLTACDDSQLVGPNEEMDGVTEIDVAQLDEILSGNPVRVAMELAMDGSVAHALDVEPDETVLDDEFVASRVLGVALDDTGGSLTLELGEIQVDFASSAQFRLEGDEETSFGAFVAAVSAAVGDGETVAIRASRAAGDHADEEGRFTATEVRILAGLDVAQLDLNLTIDNLITNDSPPPDGWVEVLGLSVELRVSDGGTAMALEPADGPRTEDFEGVVTAVDVNAGTATLRSGTVVQVDANTAVRFDEAVEGSLASLAVAAEALDQGLKVVAWGDGTVQAENPLTILAEHIALRAREAPETGTEEFEGFVAAVNLEEGTATLESGLVVQVTDETQFKSETDRADLLQSLRAVAEALEAGAKVVTWGLGPVVQDDPPTIAARRVAFLAKPPRPEGGEFEGRVVAVDPERGSVTLRNGTVILIGDETRIAQEHDGKELLTSLEAVAEALRNELHVVTWGAGTVEGHDPLAIAAQQVAFAARVPVEDFEGHVTSVDAENGSLTLANGLTVLVTDDTRIKQESDRADVVTSLTAAAEALENGLEVVAWGEGTVESRDPPTLLAIHLGMVARVPVEDFEGRVTAVDVENGQLTLGDGIVVLVTDETRIKQEHEHDRVDLLTSLAAAAEALENGLEVGARGEGTVESRDPLTLGAIHLGMAARVPVEDFEGHVVSIDVENGVVTLDEGIVVHVTEETRIKQEHQHDRLLTSLAAAAEALEGGLEVVAWGEGRVQSDDPLTITAFHVAFAVPHTVFEGAVEAIDLVAGTLTLEGNVIVVVDENTEFDHDPNDQDLLSTLAAAADRIANGVTVVAFGRGELESEDPVTIHAVRIGLKTRPPGGS